MSTIVTIDVPADEFVLRDTLEAVRDAEFEVKRVVGHQSERISPYVWVTADDLARLEDAFERDRSITNAERLEAADGAGLYRMDWVRGVELVDYVLTEEGATVMEAVGRDGTWTLRILFPEHEGLSRTSEFCADSELTFEVKRIHEMKADRQGRFSLTDVQHETLQAAFENGYYRIPRDVTVDELTEEFDVTHQAISERIRRAHRALVEDALLFDPRDGTTD